MLEWASTQLSPRANCISNNEDNAQLVNMQKILYLVEDMGCRLDD